MKYLTLVLLAAILVVLPFCLVDIPHAACTAAPQYNYLQALRDASVKVELANGSTGSGVVYKNGDANFVWTAAHVVASAREVMVRIDPATAQPAILVLYHDVIVSVAIVKRGRKVGENKRFARIIRFSNETDGGEDVALLRVYDEEFGGVGLIFSGKEPPRVGEQVWHIGSMRGDRGEHAVSDGVVAFAGRLLSRGCFNELIAPSVFDQVSAPILEGCSGGGVFLKGTGECIGLMNSSICVPVCAANLILPARRMREFATRTKCVWAIDRRVPVPDNDTSPVTDKPFPVPPEWERLRRTP